MAGDTGAPGAHQKTRSSVIARNSFWMGLDTAISFISSFVISVAVARVIGPQKLGYFSFVLWITSMTGLLTTIGGSLMLRKFLADSRARSDFDTARAILRLMFRLYFGLASTLAGLGVLIVLTSVPAEHRGYALLAALGLFPSVLLTIPTAANVSVEDVAPNVWSSLISTIVNFTGVVLSLVFTWDLVGLTAALLASRLVDFAVRYHLYRRRFPREMLVEMGNIFEAGQTPVPPMLRKAMLLFFGQATALRLLDLVVWDRSEMFFLQRFCDIKEVAFYSLSFNVVAHVLVLPRVLSLAANVTMMVDQAREPQTLKHTTASAIRYVALLAVPASLGLAALSAPLVSILYGERYLPAIPVFAIVALFAAPRALAMPVQQLFVAADRQGTLLKWGCVAGALNVGLDLLLIPRWGAIGAAFANGTTQTLTALALLVYAKLGFSVPLPVRMLAKLFAAAGFMGLLVFGLVKVTPAVAGVVLGSGIGFLVFVGLLRWARVLEASDYTRLLGVGRQLPVAVRPLYARVIAAMIPGGAVSAQVTAR